MKAKLFNYLITLTIVGLAVWAAVSLYRRYIEQPWTRDGQVRANIVGIAPRVSGPIIRVAVRDNQLLRQGDLLFEIDLVDTNSFWIAGYFKETQLPHLQVGQKAIITVMGHESQPFQGVVRSVGRAVYVQDGSSVATGFVLPVSGSNSTALLPSVNQTIDWVRLPQRFPVRIKVLGNSPVPLLIGQTVSAAMIPEVEPTDITRQLTLAQP
jgi:multidrug resistance efflux pump